MHKLMLHIIYTLIGLKNILYLLALMFLLPGCDLFRWDDGGDYKYISYIKNESNDSLRIYIHKSTSIYNIDSTIAHNSKISYNGGREVDKRDDVLTERLFYDSFDNSYDVSVYLEDSLVVKWSGPPSYMGDSIHHFYNYDSWNVELIGNVYELEFVIYESDLKGN
jgi:hypothetical protein